MPRAVLVSVLLVTLPRLVAAEPPALSWLVFPIRATQAPPLDPTLLRASKRVAQAFAASVSGAVRLESRARRDDHCRDDGWRCPAEIAALLGVDRVVSLQLSEDHARLDVEVFAGRRGAVARTSLPCGWDAGRVVCEVGRLSKFGASLAPRGLGPEVVFAVYEALEPEIRACLGARGAAPGARVRLSVSPNGRAHTVRLEPRKLQRRPRYACVTQALEGLEVAPFAGSGAGPFTFELPGPSVP